MNKNEIINLIILCAAAVTLIGLQLKPEGWWILGLGFISLVFCDYAYSKQISILYGSIAVLGLTEITTDITYTHMLTMGIPLLGVISIPYFLNRLGYMREMEAVPKPQLKKWTGKQIAYIGLAILIAYLLLPFYFRTTQAYLNWQVDLDTSHLIRLFLGTNFLGIWDELFFINIGLRILRRFMPFIWANLIQSILFTSFLYELGFTGWGFIMVFIFALIQGNIFTKTESLPYIITIHLSVDFILYLALIHAHYPHLLPIFIT